MKNTFLVLVLMSGCTGFNTPREPSPFDVARLKLESDRAYFNKVCLTPMVELSVVQSEGCLMRQRDLDRRASELDRAEDRALEAEREEQEATRARLAAVGLALRSYADSMRAQQSISCSSRVVGSTIETDCR